MNNLRVYACEEVLAVERLHCDLLTEEIRQLPIREQLDLQARRILDAHAAGNETVVTHFQCWHPELVCQSAEAIMEFPVTLEDARETMAREYGYTDWNRVVELGSEPPDQEFESAVDALLKGDVNSLRRLLEGDPSLAYQRSEYGHRSTLLHYVGANGVETYRQRVPFNLAEVAQVLLDAGADVNATAEMYGGSSTAIALLITSSHPVEAGVMDDVVKVLVDAGAETN